MPSTAPNPNDSLYCLAQLRAIDSDGRKWASGTAVILGRGWALTARHVLDGIVLDRAPRLFDLDKVKITLVAPTPTGTHIWNVTDYRNVGTSDLAILSIVAERSPVKQITQFQPEINPIPPKKGAHVMFQGFEGLDPRKDSLSSVTLASSTGIVLDVHHLGRDKGITNYPCISVSALTKGGMSGGAVFCAGKLIGIVSRGLRTFGAEEHHSIAALIWPITYEPLLPHPSGKMQFYEGVKKGYANAPGGGFSVDVQGWDDYRHIRYMQMPEGLGIVRSEKDKVVHAAPTDPKIHSTCELDDDSGEAKHVLYREDDGPISYRELLPSEGPHATELLTAYAHLVDLEQTIMLVERARTLLNDTGEKYQEKTDEEKGTSFPDSDVPEALQPLVSSLYSGAVLSYGRCFVQRETSQRVALTASSLPKNFQEAHQEMMDYRAYIVGAELADNLRAYANGPQTKTYLVEFEDGKESQLRSYVFHLTHNDDRGHEAGLLELAKTFRSQVLAQYRAAAKQIVES